MNFNQQNICKRWFVTFKFVNVVDILLRHNNLLRISFNT